MTARIEIDMDKKCKRCKKNPPTQNGYCLACITKMLNEGKFDHILDRHLDKARNER